MWNVSSSCDAEQRRLCYWSFESAEYQPLGVLYLQHLRYLFAMQPHRLVFGWLKDQFIWLEAGRTTPGTNKNDKKITKFKQTQDQTIEVGGAFHKQLLLRSS